MAIPQRVTFTCIVCFPSCIPAARPSDEDMEVVVKVTRELKDYIQCLERLRCVEVPSCATHLTVCFGSYLYNHYVHKYLQTANSPLSDKMIVL